MPIKPTDLHHFLQNIAIISKDKDAKEHSYRKDLQQLLESIDPKVSVLHEGKRLTAGTPDFRFKKNDALVAFLEAKDITESLQDKKHFKQVQKYQDGLENLCFTNNLDWQFFRGKQLIFETSIATLIAPGKLQIQQQNLSRLAFHLNQFPNRRSITLKSSKQLADLMAKKTRFLRDTLIDILNQDEQKESYSEIYNEYQAFKKILIHDLNIPQFSDIYAQTISYGLFTARYYDPTLQTFSRQEASNLLPKSNPFLRKLFHTIAGYDLDERLKWVVDNLVELLLQADTRKLMHEFGTKLNLDDPVLHFYETFLGEYDPATRKARGVYYTPDPVVKFMVKSVDEILQKEFKLPMGLADNSKIQKEITKAESQNKLNTKTTGRGRNQKHFEEFHKVQVLDPATGTGTFLLEVFNQIHRKFANKPALWQSYAQKDLLPRIHGFEILMASYTMVHLKLAMFLTEKGVDLESLNKRLSVYLTNSLEEASIDHGSLFSLTKWLTDEALEASKIKNNKPVMVVIGNPPYSVSSSNSGEWITSLVADYKKDLKERNIQPLSDDYIKFIRYGQHFIHKNREGILAYISNNSFIDGIIHRKMREELMQTFDKIYIHDLHGNSKKKETTPDGGKDENVFDIQQGVSINIFVKTGKKKEGEPAKIYHYDLFGKRKAKYDFLLENSVNSTGWTQLSPDPKYHFFVPKDFALQKEYEKGVKVSELFDVYGSGIKFRKDKLLVRSNRDEVIEMVKDMQNLEKKDILSKYDFNETKDWKVEEQRENFLELNEENILSFRYRPFEQNYTFYPLDKISKIIPRGDSRHNLMRNYKNNNLGLIVTRQISSTSFRHALISDQATDMCYVSNGGKETGYNFPLYLYSQADGDLLADQNPRPNFNPKIIKQIESGLGMELDWEAGIGETFVEDGQPKFTPTDLLDYIYAVLHSPSYRQKYKEFLKIDFPRVSFSNNSKDRFWQLVRLGTKLRKLHLMEGINPLQLEQGELGGVGPDLVEKIRFETLKTAEVDSSRDGLLASKVKDSLPQGLQKTLKTRDFDPLEVVMGKVYINDTKYFDNVPQNVWSFYIGGYQPAQKWLKDRKGRELSFDDILHYQKIVHVLGETGKLMREIDKAFQKKLE